MSNQQKKFKKKKEREKRVRKQILLQREALRAPEQEERKLRKKIKRIENLKKDMGKLNLWADDVLLQMNEQTLSQLEKNAKILKALEEEYEREHNKKAELNRQLEADGFKTLQEKLNHLHDKLVQDQKEAAGETEEVAEVEVLRAPDAPEL